MADIFKEVDEELRRDRAALLWKKYGKYAIALLVALVLAIGLYEGWKAYDFSRQSELSQDVASALAKARGDNLDTAIEALEPLGDAGGSGYGLLAAMHRARLLAEAGRVEEAIPIWESIAGNPDAEPGFKESAVILIVANRIDEGDPATLRSRLDPLLQENSPYRPMGLELAAALELRQGNEEAARELLRRITDQPDAPRSIRGRAAQLLEAIGD